MRFLLWFKLLIFGDILHVESSVCQVQCCHLRLPLATRRGAATARDLRSGTQRVDLQCPGWKGWQATISDIQK